MTRRVGSASLGLGHDPDAPEPASKGRIGLWVYTGECDELVERVSRSGATIIAPAEDQPWGEPTARVLDPDGNEVVVVQRAPGP